MIEKDTDIDLVENARQHKAMNFKKVLFAQRIEAIRQAHKAVLAREGVSLEAGLMDYTKEDVEDETGNLDALAHEQAVDFDADESEVDMESVSPEMQKACE